MTEEGCSLFSCVAIASVMAYLGLGDSRSTLHFGAWKIFISLFVSVTRREDSGDVIRPNDKGNYFLSAFCFIFSFCCGKGATASGFRQPLDPLSGRRAWGGGPAIFVFVVLSKKVPAGPSEDLSSATDIWQMCLEASGDPRKRFFLLLVFLTHPSPSLRVCRPSNPT